MRRIIRLLMPNGSGAGKRVGKAVRDAGGKVERSKIKLQASEMSLKEIVVSSRSQTEMFGVLMSLEALDDVSVVGVDHADSPERR